MVRLYVCVCARACVCQWEYVQMLRCTMFTRVDRKRIRKIFCDKAV